MDILVLGSINVDVILRVARLPGPGETMLATDLARLPGGKGANQAVAAARMGARVAMAGGVGDDADGDWMLDILAEEGIDLTGVRRIANQLTGMAMIAVDTAGENQIVVAPGANAAFVAAPAPEQAAARVILAQLEIPVETIAAMFASTSSLRILNAAPFVAAAVERLFALSDILIVNQHELADYVRLSNPNGQGEPLATDAEAIAIAARMWIVRPEQVVVVTLGAGGAVAVWADAHVHVPAIAVTPFDTVGAGDCFCGALAALVAQGEDVAVAVSFANAAAALCTQATGAVPAMPLRAAVAAVLAAQPTEYAQPIKKAAGAGLHWLPVRGVTE
ncbi:ribokinase [Sphingomonas sp. 37zxx]|uniref:ribokinase n=1 Tax=Sphingomonas sp. 37zxx TaxID=1550073 RepID=UPI00053BDF3C|nr:ribokinase [Sphingomonas sp. 37zxx]